MIEFNYTALIQFVVFLAALISINVFLFPPFLKVMKERKERTDTALEEAEKLDVDAEEKASAYFEAVRAARQESAEEAAQAGQQAVQQQQKITDDARVEAEKLLEELREKLGEESVTAQAALKNMSLNYARQMASMLMGRNIQ
ncbi:hypothetical protein ACFL4G_05565 [Thermodesulfobacteriota bacterium]